MDPKEGEIRVTTKGEINRYVGYIKGYIRRTNSNTITIKALGNAINKAVILGEVLKRRLGKLEENTETETQEVPNTDPETKENRPTKMITALTLTINFSNEAIQEINNEYQQRDFSYRPRRFRRGYFRDRRPSYNYRGRYPRRYRYDNDYDRDSFESYEQPRRFQRGGYSRRRFFGGRREGYRGRRSFRRNYYNNQ